MAQIKELEHNDEPTFEIVFLKRICIIVITSKHIMFFIRISIIGNFQPAGLKPTELDV